MSSVNSYTPKEFSLSQAAINHFSLNLAGKDSKGIRLSVSESTGCSGYTYQIGYVEKQESDDLVFKFEWIIVVINVINIFLNMSFFIIYKS